MSRRLRRRGRGRPRGRVLLTTGRGTFTAFAPLDAPFVLVRLVEPAGGPLPPNWSVVTSRGPYTAEGEVALMREHRIDVLVTTDSGGAMTEPADTRPSGSAHRYAGRRPPKPVAVGELGVRVVIVRRPFAVAGIPSVDNVASAAGWARARSSGTS